MEFKPFDKIARLHRECCITEKIDGTNAQITIVPESEGDEALSISSRILTREAFGGTLEGRFLMFAGSRTRYITPADDNFGFAGWAAQHSEELWSLGDGHHYGEWWGGKIQRGYGLAEKRFSLFNAFRWDGQNPNRPACCGVVPTLYIGPFSTDIVVAQLERLRVEGSLAAPGFMRPEGVVTYLSAAKCYFKQTLEKDDEPKTRTA